MNLEYDYRTILVPRLIKFILELKKLGIDYDETTIRFIVNGYFAEQPNSGEIKKLYTDFLSSVKNALALNRIDYSKLIDDRGIMTIYHQRNALNEFFYPENKGLTLTKEKQAVVEVGEKRSKHEITTIDNIGENADVDPYQLFKMYLKNGGIEVADCEEIRLVELEEALKSLSEIEWIRENIDLKVQTKFSCSDYVRTLEESVVFLHQYKYAQGIKL